MSASSIAELVGSLDRRKALHWLACLNGMLTGGGTYDEEFQDSLSLKLFDHDILNRLSNLASGTEARVVHFHPGLLRPLVKLVAEHANPNGGRSPVEGGVSTQVGRLILSIASITAWDRYSPDNEADRHLLGAVLSATQMYRASRDHQRILPVKDWQITWLKEHLALDDAVMSKHNVSIDEIIRAHLLMWVYFSRASPAYFSNFESLHADPRYIFGKGGLSKRVGEWFAARYLLKERTAPESFEDETLREYLLDTWLIQERPLFEIEPNAWICLDFDALQRQMARGLFNLANEALERNLYEHLGEAFDNYLHDALKESSRNSKKSVTVPKPKRTQPDLDGAYQNERATLLFECKTGVVSPKAIRQCDLDTVAKDLNRKFVLGPKRNKGFAQLVKRVEIFQSTPEVFGLKSTQYVIPIVVVEDSFCECSFVDTWCQMMAQGEFKRFGPAVPGVHLLHVSDIALLCSLSEELDLADAIFELSLRGYRGELSVSHWVDMMSDTYSGEEGPASDRVMTGLLGDAFDSLFVSFQSGYEKQCPDCTATMTPLLIDGVQRWVCLDDFSHSRPVVSEIEDLEFRAERERIIKSYERS